KRGARERVYALGHAVFGLDAFSARIRVLMAPSPIRAALVPPISGQGSLHWRKPPGDRCPKTTPYRLTDTSLSREYLLELRSGYHKVLIIAY
ncbi:hypothetical protein, partial [Methanoculleus sp.]|uniref:hypothetical protein n=1 Tax=Methanoculleus sp. TaxID=90427 RepID=UPI0025CF862F